MTDSNEEIRQEYENIIIKRLERAEKKIKQQSSQIAALMEALHEATEYDIPTFTRRRWITMLNNSGDHYVTAKHKQTVTQQRGRTLNHSATWLPLRQS